MEELFDTVILIDALKGIQPALTTIRLCKTPAISLVTWVEVMAGANSGNEGAVRRYLASFVTLPITNLVAEQSAQLRRDTRLKLPDAFIFATALLSNRLLVTRNTRDFHAGMAGVRIPYQL